MAKLYFRYGAMNSGKTTALMQVAYNYKERGMRVLILKPAIDTKGQDSILSRLGISCKVDKLVTPDMDVVELVRADGRSGHSGHLLRPAGRFHDARLSRLDPAAGDRPYDRGAENHLRLRPQGHLQRAQGQRRICL